MSKPKAQTQVVFPFGSNIRYLPLVYLIPKNQIVRYPTLNALPRCLSEIAASEPMMDLLDSDAFLKDIMDATAALAFPHFGFSGQKQMEVLTLKKENERLRRFVDSIPPEVRRILREQQRQQRPKDHDL